MEEVDLICPGDDKMRWDCLPSMRKEERDEIKLSFKFLILHPIYFSYFLESMTGKFSKDIDSLYNISYCQNILIDLIKFVYFSLISLNNFSKLCWAYSTVFLNCTSKNYSSIFSSPFDFCELSMLRLTFKDGVLPDITDISVWSWLMVSFFYVF